SSNITDMRSATAIKTELYQGSTDELYYTKSQITSLLSGKANTSHGHDPIGSSMSGPARGTARYSSLTSQNVPQATQTWASFGTANRTDSLITRSTFSSGHMFSPGASGIWAVTASCE